MELGKTCRALGSFIFILLVSIGSSSLAEESQNNRADGRVARQSAGEYPVSTRTKDNSIFFEAGDASKKANASYPEWFRGAGKNGLADEHALYWSNSLITPKQNAAENPEAENLYFGLLELKPGVTYPAHNHPANELYFVLNGEADWYVNDEKQHVTAGSVIRHRSFDAHGWVNTNTEDSLQLVWLWWLEGEDTLEMFEHGARFTNPELTENINTIKPYAVPLPRPCPRDQKCLQNYPGPYPIYGRTEKTTAFFNERDARKQSDEHYPEWYRGKAKNNLADEASMYWYRELVTPKRYAVGNLEAESLYFGTLDLLPGATYPAQHHPSNEFYFVVEGEADWYVNDRSRKVKRGSLIRHQPYDVHGFVNTHQTQSLKVVWARWLEGNDTQEVFGKGATLINPDLVKAVEDIKPFAVLPPKSSEEPD